MAISVGNVSTASGGESSLNTLSVSHTVAAGSDRILIVAVGESRNVSVTSVTFNGVGLSLAAQAVNTNTNARLYYLVNPPVGTYTVTVNYGSSLQFLLYGVANFYGVDQSTPFPTTNTNAGIIKDKTISITTANANSYLIECFGDAGTTNSPASSQTYINNGVNRSSAYSTTTTSGSYTRNWTGDVLSQYAQVIAEMKESVAVTDTSKFFQLF